MPMGLAYDGALGKWRRDVNNLVYDSTAGKWPLRPWA